MRTVLFIGLLVLSKSIAAQTGFLITEEQQELLGWFLIAFISADFYELIFKD